MTESRNVGVPEGRSEYIERVWRTVHADGTITDSAPTRTLTPGSVAAAIKALTEPRPIGKRVLLERTVVTEATPWREAAATLRNGDQVIVETKVDLT